jgi:predicted alpha/beta-fold hydrolase
VPAGHAHRKPEQEKKPRSHAGLRIRLNVVFGVCFCAKRRYAPRVTAETAFRPFRWLKSPHLQTIGAAVPLFSRPGPHPGHYEEELRFPVGHRPNSLVCGKLHACAWWAHRPAPAVILLHGIAGSKESHCVVRAGMAFRAEGYHVIRLDMRGAGSSVADAPSLYHAGLTTDLDLVVRAIAKDPRVTCVTVLGFSGGGSQALKLAGEWGSKVPAGVAAIATVSAPLDYTKVAARMDTFACLPYRFHVLRGLVERAWKFADRFPERAHFQPADLDSVRRFRTYDESIIVPMHSFRDVDRYYRESSSGQWLGRIEVPTMILHAADDPMVPVETIRPWLADASRAVESRISTQGGHIGWLAGLDEESWTKGWATKSALSFFAGKVRRESPRAAQSASRAVPRPRRSSRDLAVEASA